MRGGIREGAGRKPIVVDIVEVEKLASIQCTEEEMAAFLNISVRTFQNRLKDREFAEAAARGKAKGRISVRRHQMKILEKGSAAMGIWLGKQLLDQRDVTPTELSGPNSGPVKIQLEVIDEIRKRARKRARNLSNN
jgi:hypothetical protein